MKTTLIGLSTTILVLLKTMGIIYGQDLTDLTVQRGLYTFQGSEKKDIVVPVTKQSNILILDITSTISDGVLTIEIYDPNNEKQGNFSISGQLSSSKAITKNQIDKNLTIYSVRKELLKNFDLNEKSLEVFGIGKENVQGQLSRSIKNPIEGNWVIKINCTNARGLFILDTNQKLFTENQPSKLITGTVTDANKKPFKVAYIVIRGTTIGTISDKSGNFSLNVPGNAEFLQFSADGMKTQEVKIGEQTRFAIVLNQ